MEVNLEDVQDVKHDKFQRMGQDLFIPNISRLVHIKFYRKQG